jgi:hypothetical protein
MAHPGSTKSPQSPLHVPNGGSHTLFPGTAIPPAPLQFALPAYPVALVPVRPSRAKYYVMFVLLMLLGGVVGYLLAPRAGVLELSLRPPDARLYVDGVAVVGRPPFRIKQPAGVHRLTVSRPGYVAYAQDILISSGQRGQMDIALVPSPDTGFKLTSKPPGGEVWLDGQPLVVDKDGQQATTDLLAPGIAPGPHQVEIKGVPGYQPWQAQFTQEPSRVVVLHAELLPAPAGTEASPSPAHRPTARVTVPTPPTDSTPEEPEEKPPAPSVPDRIATGDDPFDRPSTTEADSTSTQDCVVTIGSKPVAELLIDGKTTGKSTPLTDYTLPCGTHRLTFRNKDLLIERNERVTVAPGRPYKKTFHLVPDDLF